MKIMFICGSLQPSKDGVGDYTRRLAGELIRKGHSCAIVAIMDKGVSATKEEIQESEFTNIPVLRLPYANGYKLNCIGSKLWVDNFNPNWISLQYVPFSFHPKGLPISLGKWIKQLIQGRKLHIMFHELWVGMNEEATPKLKIWGTVQRAIIKSFIKNVKPSSIHTQIKLYQWQLKKMNVNAFLLPLFSNIKVIDFIPTIIKKKCINFVVFGTIHPGVVVEDFTNCIVKYSSENNIDIKIIFIGRNGVHLQHWIEICNSKNISINVMGEQPSSKISEVLSMVDFGIATTPLLTAEKSGTVVAMIEHGLSVLCVSKPWKVKKLQKDCTPFGMHFFNGDDLSLFFNSKKERLEINTVSTISKVFINSLQQLK